MGQHHHEPLIEAPVEMPSEKSTGLVFSGVCAIAAAFFHSNMAVAALLLVASAGFGGLAMLRPTSLKTLNSAWFSFALLLNKIVSPVVMLVLYGLVIVPCGLLMQVFRDPLRRQRSAATNSYWIERDHTREQSTMRDQF